MSLARTIQSPKCHAYSCRIQIQIFRCSHRWEVLAIIFLPSPKKLWPNIWHSTFSKQWSISHTYISFIQQLFFLPHIWAHQYSCHLPHCRGDNSILFLFPHTVYSTTPWWQHPPTSTLHLLEEEHSSCVAHWSVFLSQINKWKFVPLVRALVILCEIWAKILRCASSLISRGWSNI